MLQELHVKNFGIIEDIDWKLDAGLNVITGETGAGKSLIIDAVEILLNGSAGEEVIRHGCAEARIEGVFELPERDHYREIRAFLAEKGLPPEDDLLIISYEIKPSRSGQVRVNNRSVTKGLLRQIGRQLIDIHGQSQHLSLLDTASHLVFLDGYAHNLGLKEQFAALSARLKEREAELADLQAGDQAALRQQEFLRFQIEEIDNAGLREGEDEELENERRLITHAARLKEEAGQIYNLLSQGDASGYSPSVISALHQAVQSLKKLCDLDASLSQPLENLEKAFYGIEETARDINQYAEKLDFDPHRQEEVEARLELIGKLKRKYGQTLAAILDYREQSQQEMNQINGSQERQFDLHKLIAADRTEAARLGWELSAARAAAAAALAGAVKQELADLDMGQMDFAVSLAQTPSEHGLPGPDGQAYAWTPEGLDRVEFTAATNPGEPLRPLVKIASTGEISRFTLALKSALAGADRTPVLIFDEIDIGVGGRNGEIVGKKLWTLARSHQVVCITHLPQIAAYADAHCFVHKQSREQRTVSTLEYLDAAARVRETALMLAGHQYSEAAQQNARELLSRAADWKKAAADPSA